jgi:integrase
MRNSNKNTNSKPGRSPRKAPPPPEPEQRIRVRPRPIPGVEIREYKDAHGAYYRFRVRFTNASGQRDQETLDTPQDALDFKAKLRLMARRGNLHELDTGEQTLVQFMPEFWSLYAKRSLAEVTRRKYRSAWNTHILPRRISKLPMRQITPLVLYEYAAELEDDGIGPAVIRGVLGMLQSMFQRAVEWGKATVNVVKQIKKPSAPRQRAIVPMTPETVEKIRRAMMELEPRRGVRDATLVSIMGYTGMRPEDALALEKRHPQQATILVEQKVSLGVLYPGQKTNRPPRSPRLFKQVRGDIDAYCELFGIEDGLLFALDDGEPWGATAYKNWRVRVWQPACVIAGVGRIETYRKDDGKYGRRYSGAVPYDLRHSFASLLIHEGKLSIVEIANQLGHSTETLLRVYTHVIAEMQGKPRVPAETAIERARAKVHRGRGPEEEGLALAA